MDTAATITVAATAPPSPAGGRDSPRGGGSGGGHGAAGGQGVQQPMVGVAHGSVYQPTHFGSRGGRGGGGTDGATCVPRGTHAGGVGGGVIALAATTRAEIDGVLTADGGDPEGGRGGGGAGGSIYIATVAFLGQGVLSVRGGRVPRSGNCSGGGGGGGRIAVHYNTSGFTGRADAHGGASERECGGAGTVLWHNNTDDTDALVVDNNNTCRPLSATIDYGDVGADSFRTWLFDDDRRSAHDFLQVELSGGAQLALAPNGKVATQKVMVAKSIGDKTGVFHIGPSQVNAGH